MIPDWVAGYIGLPFQDRGRTREGLDCWGLVALVYRERFAIELPSYVDDYPSTRDRVTLARLFLAEATSGRWRRVPIEAVRVPDVLVIRMATDSHVGLIVAPGRFLHVMVGRQTCVERLASLAWSRRIDGAYHHEAIRD